MNNIFTENIYGEWSTEDNQINDGVHSNQPDSTLVVQHKRIDPRFTFT